MTDKYPVKISVAMPVYNGEKFLARAIESVLGQTYGDFEFIIIDDASTDGSPEKIKSYKDSRIRFLQNNLNIGQSKSLNLAIESAAGEFVARMDQDDICNKHRFQKQINFLINRHDIALLGTSAIVIDENGKRTGKVHASCDGFRLRMEILFSNPMIHSSVIIRKDALLSLGGYDESFVLGQDYDLWSRALEAGYEFTNIEEPLVSLRMHSNSSSAIHRAERFILEASKIIKKNALTLAGINISNEEAISISKTFHSPVSLGDEEMGNGVKAMEKVFYAFMGVCNKRSGEINKMTSRFKYIIAMAYSKRNDAISARRYFLEALRTHPYDFNLLARFIFQRVF